MYNKDIAKVMVGFSFAEIIYHILLILGKNLPFDFFGLTITPLSNFIVLVSWIIICAFSIHYAWFKKQPTIFDRLSHIIKK